jgi:hypothetical protein
MPQLGYSNNAHYKTSDQSNALVWLRHLLVHYTADELYLGRAVPRAWLADGTTLSATDMHTPFGRVSVSYSSQAASGRIVATVEMELHELPRRCLLRFRHPANLPVRSIEIDGKPLGPVDAVRGDVDLTGMSGRLEVVSHFCLLPSAATSG